MFDEQHISFETDRGTNDVDGLAQRKALCASGYPLVLSKSNEELTICSMHGGRHYRRQLMDMGLRPGTQIRVMRSSGGGPMLVQVGETRLGIGRSMAEKIEVVPVS